jgi:ATP-binding protein involved in chromosome partitioning
MTESDVQKVLARFQDPETGRNVVQLQQIHGLTLEGGKLAVTLGLTTWAAPLWEETREELTALLQKEFPGLDVSVKLIEHFRPAMPQGQMALQVKSVIAVGAGKGGVGKSSIAAYLAIGLARAGAKVGLMDADLYGPSIPHLLGIREQPYMAYNKIQPIEKAGVKVLSMGMLVPPGEAVIWRGPMLHSALTQFLQDTEWGNLDYLVIDLPPGTGDVAISLSQLLPPSGAVVVCTPQDVALLDATKAIAMFRKVNIPVLGMVENMSFFLCSNCGARHDIFGTGGARRRAGEMGVPFLGEVPLETQLRVLADEGRIAAAFDDATARPCLEAICRTLVRGMADDRRKKPVQPTLPLL